LSVRHTASITAQSMSRGSKVMITATQMTVKIELAALPKKMLRMPRTAAGGGKVIERASEMMVGEEITALIVPP
jgi:hypothetical protein